MAGIAALNVWYLRHQDGRYVQIWWDSYLRVIGLNPDVTICPNLKDHGFVIWETVPGTIVLQSLLTYSLLPFACSNASVRFGFVRLREADDSDWITQLEDGVSFLPQSTGDGYFALYSRENQSYVTISPSGEKGAFHPLTTAGPVTDIAQAARFYAEGFRSPALDLVELTGSAAGMDFDGADLSGWDLSKYNLSNCNLSKCNLANCDLQDCNVQGADLSDCNLSNANLASCDLSKVSRIIGSTMDSANARQAKLSGLQFDSVSISEVDFTGAILTGCNLTSVQPWKRPPILAASNLRGADLSKVDLAGLNLAGADLRGANLAGCNLTNASLTGANLSGLDLRSTVLAKANLTGANLQDCNLANVDLSGAILVATNFTGCDLTTVHFSLPLAKSADPLHPTVLANCKLSFTGIGPDWSCLDMTGAKISGFPTKVSSLNASSANLSSVSFQGLAITKTNFSQATLDEADFTNSTLSDVTFEGTRMVGTVFTSAKIVGCNFVGAALGGIRGSGAAKFSYSYIASCDFSQADLFGVVFSGATMITNTLNSAANLQEADFSNAYMPATDFSGAVLQGATFDGAFMVQSNLTNADLSPGENGAVPSSLVAACLQGVNFQATNLSGANLPNAAITDVAGTILQQYYDESGVLTQPFPLPYPQSSFPVASCFSASTICPNLDRYDQNVSNGLSIAQMMNAPHPPNSWCPQAVSEGGKKSNKPQSGHS
jgi:uncharacterized protein YjbI with pentapeptide repeats